MYRTPTCCSHMTPRRVKRTKRKFVWRSRELKMNRNRTCAIVPTVINKATSQYLLVNTAIRTRPSCAGHVTTPFLLDSQCTFPLAAHWRLPQLAFPFYELSYTFAYTQPLPLCPHLTQRNEGDYFIRCTKPTSYDLCLVSVLKTARATISSQFDE